MTTGVHGAGGLTAQHLIGAGALLGLFPKELLRLAEIATTTATWEFLSTNRGYKLENAAKEMPQLLAAVACSLNTTEFVAENVVCKQVQESTGTGKRYVDSVFEGHFLYYLQQDATTSRIMCVTPSGKEVATPICWKKDTISSGFVQAGYSCVDSFWKRSVGKVIPSLKRHGKRCGLSIPDTLKKRRAICSFPQGFSVCLTPLQVPFDVRFQAAMSLGLGTTNVP